MKKANMKTLTKTLILGLLINSGVQAQVGIGNNFPNDSTILDLTNGNNRGFLLPKITGLLPNPTSTYLNGMALFSDTDSLIYIKTSPTTFNGLSPWKYKVNAAISNDVFLEYGQVGVGYSYGTTLVAELDVNGDINASGKVKENGEDLLPRGTIVMWSGTSAPAGWGLCTGATYAYNGLTTQSPNLRGRFVLGYDSGNTQMDNPGNLSTGGTSFGETGGSVYGSGTLEVGGSASFNITAANLPPHTHSSGSLATNSTGSHDHNYTDRRRNTSGVGNFAVGSPGSTTYATGGTGTGSSPYSTGNAGNHSHTISGSTGSAGSGTNCTITSAENTFSYSKPRYYTLAYIIKL